MRRLFWTRTGAALLLAALVAGCASAPAPVARLGLRMAPATLGQAIDVQQQLTVEQDGRTHDLLAALEVDSAHLRLVGLALGMRVLSLEYDGEKVNEWRHPMLPAQVRADDVLEDLQLTLWPREAIAAALPPGWEIRDEALRRTLLLHGEVVATITYSTMPRWKGTAVLDNVRYRYRLTVVSADE